VGLQPKVKCPQCGKSERPALKGQEIYHKHTVNGKDKLVLLERQDDD
jgi:hypothetical protein